MGSSHEADIVAWAQEQTQLLRGENLSAVDALHVAQEIENLGKSVQQELPVELAVLVAHLLMLHFQPEGRQREWQLIVTEQRRRMKRKLRCSPSLEHLVRNEEWLDSVWKFAAGFARPYAADYIPDFWIWSVEQVLDEEFWPD